MSKLQFVALIASSISSFVLVILAWIYSNARLSRLEALVDSSNARLEGRIQGSEMRLEGLLNASNAKHEGGIASLRSDLERGLAGVRTHHDGHMAEIRARLASIDNHLMTFYTITGKLEGSVDELSARVGLK